MEKAKQKGPVAKVGDKSGVRSLLYSQCDVQFQAVKGQMPTDIYRESHWPDCGEGILEEQEWKKRDLLELLQSLKQWCWQRGWGDNRGKGGQQGAEMCESGWQALEAHCRVRLARFFSQKSDSKYCRHCGL